MPKPEARVVLVTGASRGIGAATALRLAQEGYALAINYRVARDEAEALVAGIVAAGGRAAAFQADVSDEAQVERLFAQCERDLGPLYGLVNNAGILEQQMRLQAMDAQRLQRVFATNVIGSMLCAREAVRRLSTRNGGTGGAIVNVSSAAARLGSPGEYVDYAASKGAIDSFTIGLAREVAGEGIRVNAVRPGFIETGIHAAGGEPDRLQRIAPSLPMARAGRAEEVAEAIAWLMSDKASYCTGTFIDVSGGR